MIMYWFDLIQQKRQPFTKQKILFRKKLDLVGMSDMVITVMETEYVKHLCYIRMKKLLIKSILFFTWLFTFM